MEINVEKKMYISMESDMNPDINVNKDFIIDGELTISGNPVSALIYLMEKVKEYLSLPVNKNKIEVRVVVANDGVELPSLATEGSSGYDVRSTIQHLLQPGEAILVNTGLYFELPKGYRIIIVPRSGIANKKLVITPNSPGLLDGDYRGELMVGLFNVGTEVFEINNGDRIAQIYVEKDIDVEFVKVDTLNSTDRGAGGFGSSGVK